MPATTRTSRHAASKSRRAQTDSDWVIDLTRGTAYRVIHPTMAAAKRGGAVVVGMAAAIWAFDIVSLVSHLGR